jgi:hypothetical protein
MMAIGISCSIIELAVHKRTVNPLNGNITVFKDNSTPEVRESGTG